MTAKELFDLVAERSPHGGTEVELSVDECAAWFEFCDDNKLPGVGVPLGSILLGHEVIVRLRDVAPSCV